MKTDEGDDDNRKNTRTAYYHATATRRRHRLCWRGSEEEENKRAMKTSDSGVGGGKKMAEGIKGSETLAEVSSLPHEAGEKGLLKPAVHHGQPRSRETGAWLTGALSIMWPRLASLAEV